MIIAPLALNEGIYNTCVTFESFETKRRLILVFWYFTQQQFHKPDESTLKMSD